MHGSLPLVYRLLARRPEMSRGWLRAMQQMVQQLGQSRSILHALGKGKRLRVQRVSVKLRRVNVRAFPAASASERRIWSPLQKRTHATTTPSTGACPKRSATPSWSGSTAVLIPLLRMWRALPQPERPICVQPWRIWPIPTMMDSWTAPNFKRPCSVLMLRYSVVEDSKL